MTNFEAETCWKAAVCFDRFWRWEQRGQILWTTCRLDVLLVRLHVRFMLQDLSYRTPTRLYIYIWYIYIYINIGETSKAILHPTTGSWILLFPVLSKPKEEKAAASPEPAEPVSTAKMPWLQPLASTRNPHFLPDASLFESPNLMLWSFWHHLPQRLVMMWLLGSLFSWVQDRLSNLRWQVTRVKSAEDHRCGCTPWVDGGPACPEQVSWVHEPRIWHLAQLEVPKP